MSDLPDGFTLDQPNNQQSAPAALPDGFQLDHPSLWTDTAKATGAGLEQATAHTVGLPGDLATLGHAVLPQGVSDAVKSVPGAAWLYKHLPTSQAVLDSASNPVVDPNYAPQTGLGGYAKDLAQNGTMGLAMGMGFAPAAASAILGHAGGEIAGTPGAVIGGLAGGFADVPNYLMSKAATVPLKDAAALKDVANNVYDNNPIIAGSRVDPNSTAQVSLNAQGVLAKARIKAGQAPTTYGTLNDMFDPNGIPPSIADLHNFRTDLGETIKENTAVDGTMNREARAAGMAKDVLDKYLNNIPQSDIISGDPQGAAALIKDAGGNWKIQASSQKLDNIVGNAELNNNSAHSAMNLGNNIRQAVKPMLRNDAAMAKRMGFTTPEDLDALNAVNAGDFKTNTYRNLSNFFGGGGGVGAALIGHTLAGAAGGGSEGYNQYGPMGAVAGTVLGSMAGAAPGQILRMMANNRTMKMVQAVQENLLSKAPANMQQAAANRAIQAGNEALRANAMSQGYRNAALLARNAALYGNGSQ